MHNTVKVTYLGDKMTKGPMLDMESVCLEKPSNFDIIVK